MVKSRRWIATLPVALSAGLVSFAGFFAALEAAAQGNNNRSSVSRGGYYQQRMNQSNNRSYHRRHPNRHLLPPVGLGSATNAPPGFYQQLNAPRVHHPPAPQPTPVYVPYPYVVYVESPDYAVSPPVVGTSPDRYAERDVHQTERQTATEPQPVQPIYVIQQPTATPAVAPPQPVPRQELAPLPPPAPSPRHPTATSFAIRPATAMVYLDDELLGTGTDLNEQTLVLPPGVYVLEVTHAAHKPQRLVFGVSSGDPVEVVVDLTDERVGRRSRIR